MDHEQLRAAVIKKLRASNWLASLASTDMVICQGIKAVTGKTRPNKTTQLSYMRKFIGLDIEPEPMIDPDPFVPQKAVARTWGHRPAHKPPVHLRAHEIDRLPRPIAMSGVGIGGNNAMGRGR